MRICHEYDNTLIMTIYHDNEKRTFIPPVLIYRLSDFRILTGHGMAGLWKNQNLVLRSNMPEAGHILSSDEKLDLGLGAKDPDFWHFQPRQTIFSRNCHNKVSQFKGKHYY